MAGLYSEAEQQKIGIDSYYSNAETRTKPNSTLFVAFRDASASVPAGEARAAFAESLFSGQPGYGGVRYVRAMCFVDFDSIKNATSAMMRWQNHKGLAIDYDKDTGVAKKRKVDSEEYHGKNKRDAQSCNYFCVRCGTKALQTNGKLLSAMPARSTGARVVDEVVGALSSLLLEPIADAQPALVKREKGTERQYRLGCRSCAAFIAYRSTPVRTEGKFLYVDPEAVSDRPLIAPNAAAASASTSTAPHDGASAVASSGSAARVAEPKSARATDADERREPAVTT